jgi:transglutaminase-like putative cysteine protease
LNTNPEPGTRTPEPVLTARYRIQHETRYVYQSTVATSQHVAYLTPRELPYQHVVSSGIEVAPRPAGVTQRTDYFGNAVEQFQLLRPHTELAVIARSIVEVRRRASPAPAGDGMPWEQARDTLCGAGPGRGSSAEALTRDVRQFLFASPYVPPSPEIEAFARASFPAARPMLAGAIDLMHRIYSGFTFDPSATNVTTPVTRVLAERRGVCQDFAHFQVSCLRSLGLAARYVSGYLLTDPPPGQARLVGADASHAWLSVYSPDDGWVDLDPTNDVVVSQRHVTLAWGRDYGDVSPLRGVLLGGASHKLAVAVSVIPAADETADRASDPPATK